MRLAARRIKNSTRTEPTMSDTPPGIQPQPVPQQPAVPSDLRPLVIVCYFLFLIACVNGLTALIGVVIAHTRRRDAVGTVWQSHFENLILVFWVFVAALLIAIVSLPFGLLANFSFFFLPHPTAILIWPPWLFLLPVIFGLVVFPILVLWYFYRTIKGLIRAAESRPYRG
jgi:uncharacterized membrane protein